MIAYSYGLRGTNDSDKVSTSASGGGGAGRGQTTRLLNDSILFGRTQPVCRDFCKFGNRFLY